MRIILAWFVCIALVVFTFSPGCAIAGSAAFGYKFGTARIDVVAGSICGFIAWLSAVIVIALAVRCTQGLWWMGWLMSVAFASLGVLHALLIACYPLLGKGFRHWERAARWTDGMELWFALLAFLSVTLLFLTQYDRDDEDDAPPVTVEPIDEGPAPGHQQTARPSNPGGKTKPK